MKILLIRGLDQFVFRGMDTLGEELRAAGHETDVYAPVTANWNAAYYDVLIGNSQGSVSVMNRPVLLPHVAKPKMIITVDLPAHPGWKVTKDVKHLNIYGTWYKTQKHIEGAVNKYLPLNHLELSLSADMRKLVKDFITTNGK